MKENNVANLEIVYVDDLPEAQDIVVGEGQSLRLSLAAFKTMKDATFSIRVDKNGCFEGSFADFSTGNYHFTLNVYLLGQGSRCEWHSAVLAKNSDDKIIDTSVFHKVGETVALMSNYGISRDASKLVFTGVSEIEKGSRKSQTRQDAKIIVFDSKSDAQASPILKIVDNDVMASHAAVVGRLNEEHLFYLQSRGLSLDEAKRLITLGYLKPIEVHYEDPSLIQRIDEAIEGGVER
jgi:Fe-S cluster assembly protein SufD